MKMSEFVALLKIANKLLLKFRVKTVCYGISLAANSQCQGVGARNLSHDCLIR